MPLTYLVPLHSGRFETLDRNYKWLNNENVFNQSQIWNFQVSTVMGFNFPVICLLLDLTNEIGNLTGYRYFRLSMTTRANSFGGLFFEATEKEEANYETSPEDGDDHYVSTNHLLDNYVPTYVYVLCT